MRGAMNSATAGARTAGALTAAVVAALLLSTPLSAQEREGDAEVRRKALIEQWDAAAGSTEANTGVTFAKWLAAVGSARGAALRSSITVPQPQQWVNRAAPSSTSPQVRLFWGSPTL